MDRLKLPSMAEKKALEYVERIRQGEDVYAILSGLTPTLQKALARAAYPSLIPPAFRGLSSADIAATWQIPVFDNPKTQRHLQAYRALVIASVRLYEQEHPQTEAKATPTRPELLQCIKQTYNNIYFAHRGSLRDELFLAGTGCEYTDDQGITHHWERVDGDIGSHFEAHGIAKGDQLSTLIQILEHGIDPSKPFHAAPFEVPDELRAGLGAALGTAGGTAYKDGLAILVSGYNVSLQHNGIKYVFINDVFGQLKPLLQQAFPRYHFCLLSEQKSILEREAQR